ncbi:Hypothetical protein PACV_132 [Pacmanvirus A23]|uniref:Hypothetical protein n=1 Tax=Pacmanvirus A23 TaxID=1932881 RepID=UPI000A094BB4|nr:Hypothetical protein B9W72_gp131 [Pacmanvirus A23]SIP85848.1 Hypothetical protein PACV_132 [Pacmanvirus A23]
MSQILQEYLGLIVDARSKMKLLLPSIDSTSNTLYPADMLKLLDAYIEKFDPKYTVDNHGRSYYIDTVLNDAFTSVTTAIAHSTYDDGERKCKSMSEQNDKLFNTAEQKINEIRDETLVSTLVKTLDDILDLSELHQGPTFNGDFIRDSRAYKSNFETRITALRKESEELTEFIKNVTALVKKQNEVDEKSAKQEALIQELQENIKNLQIQNSSLTSERNDLDKEVNRVQKLNKVLAGAVDSLSLKAERNYNAILQVEKSHEACIKEFELINVSKSISL